MESYVPFYVSVESITDLSFRLYNQIKLDEKLEKNIFAICTKTDNETPSD
jgi:hypothetical protein